MMCIKKKILNKKDIKDIKMKYLESSELIYDLLAFEYDVSNQTIKYIIKNKIYYKIK